jgi:hypothetical protein
MQRDEIKRALVSYGTVPRSYGHGRHLDKVICTDCGKPVGEKGRGSKQCWDCLIAEIEREKGGEGVKA